MKPVLAINSAPAELACKNTYHQTQALFRARYENDKTMMRTFLQLDPCAGASHSSPTPLMIVRRFFWLEDLFPRPPPSQTTVHEPIHRIKQPFPHAKVDLSTFIIGSQSSWYMVHVKRPTVQLQHARRNGASGVNGNLRGSNRPLRNSSPFFHGSMDPIFFNSLPPRIP